MIYSVSKIYLPFAPSKCVYFEVPNTNSSQILVGYFLTRFFKFSFVRKDIKLAGVFNKKLCDRTVFSNFRMAEDFQDNTKLSRLFERISERDIAEKIGILHSIILKTQDVINFSKNEKNFSITKISPIITLTSNILLCLKMIQKIYPKIPRC